MLSYETIFSRSRALTHDPKELTLDVNDLNEIYIERLHMVLGDIRIRRVFNTVKAYDDIMQLDFTLHDALDKDSDNEYVANLLSLGMAIRWLQPKVDSIIYAAPFIGGKEEKRLMDNHSDMMERLETLKIELNKSIRDRGYIYNSYLGGGN